MSPFDLPRLKNELQGLRDEMAAPEFWNDTEKSSKVNQKAKALENKINSHEKLTGRVQDALLLIQMAQEEEDSSVIEEIGKEKQALAHEVETLRLSTLLKGQYDANNAILSLHAGAGGTEAQDWVSMLYRMYMRYCEKNGYQTKLLDMLEGDEAGIKSVTFMAIGDNAYGYLKAEKGVHRLVRISPFDASARRHTSFASLDVMPEIEDDTAIEIRQEDLKIDTYRSGGKGGQNVNKVESAIRITHIPTGIITQCQNERSQLQNKETALKMLRSKLIELKEREMMEKNTEIKGEMKKIEWGSQIRSYVFHPYSMVKDHRTGTETGNVQAVMDGELEEFISSYLQKS